MPKLTLTGVFVFYFLFCSNTAFSQITYTVTNTNDSGAGSLRQAITDANDNSGADIIEFNIPNTDGGYNISGTNEQWTISPSTDLPAITESVVLDATMQPGSGNYRIKISGQGSLDDGFLLNTSSAAGSEIYGFEITGFNVNGNSTGINIFFVSTIGSLIGASGKGNVINNCSLGISFSLSQNNIIQGNLIGTDTSGTVAIANGAGIFISSAGSQMIGGSNPSDGNLISGNTNEGININASGAHTIEGNLIGTTISGLVALPNNHGVQITTSNSNNIIDNVISANTNDGIRFGFSSSNTVQGNNIGVGSDGITPLPNNIGITDFQTLTSNNNLYGGLNAGEANIIAHNTNQGILINNANHESFQIIANSIYQNGGKGIDLGGAGNNNKSSPLIIGFTTTDVSGVGTTGDDIHVYRDNEGVSPLQGKEYLGTTTVLGDGTWTASSSITLSASDFINATATDGDGNTSEFTYNFENALHFSGDDDYVNAGEFMPQSYTKEAWVRIEPGSDRNNFISSDDIVNGHYVYAPIVNSYHLSAGHFVGSALTSIIDIVPLDFDKWYHVAVTYNSVTQDMILYKNGQIVGNQTVANHSDPTVLLGSHNFLNLLTGNLDEVRIWDDVRTQAEIQANMTSTLIGNEANLVTYYRFDQGTPGIVNTGITTLPDRSLNQNDGTLTKFDLGVADVNASNWVKSNAFNPFDPTNLFTSEVSTTQIDLSWNDNALNETGYTIERSDGNNSSYTVLNTIAADATSYSDNTVSAENGYFYRVIANGASGDSNPSNEKFGSTITPPGNALDFDGVDDFVSIDDHADFQFGTGDFTVETWFYFDGISKKEGVISKRNPVTPFEQFTIMIGDGFFAGGPGKKLFIAALPDGRLPGTNDRFVASPSNLTVGWHHVAMVQDYDTELILYVDGANVGNSTTSHGGLTFDIIGQPLTIGSFNGSGYFDGQVDDVRIWSDVRSEADILGNLFTTLVGNEANLAAYYRFDQGTAGVVNTGITTLPDRSQNNNNGTLTNFDLGVADVTISNWVNSGSGAFNVTITPSGVPIFCEGGSITLTASPAGADSYQWLVEGVQIPGETSNTLTATQAAQSGNYNVEVTIGGNTLTAVSDIPVVIFPAPVYDPAFQAANVCSGNTTGLTFATTGFPTATSYNIVSITVDPGLTPVISGPTGSGLPGSTIADDIYTNATGSPLNVTYNVIPEEATCDGVAVDVVITIDPTPTVDAGNDIVICEGSTVRPIGSFGGSASSAFWSTSGNGVFDDFTILTPVYTPGSTDITNGSVTLTLTTNDPPGGCPALSNQLIVTIEALPTVNAGGDLSICAGGTANLLGIIGGGASTATWSTSGTGTFDNNTLLNAVYTPSPADTLAGSVILTLTTDDPPGLCTSQTSQLTLTIGSGPSANAGGDQVICEGDVVSLSGSIGGTATFSTWTTSGDGSFDNASLPNATYTPGSNDITNGSVALTLTTDDPGGICGVATDQVTISIELLPTANAGPDQTICSTEPINLSGSIGGDATSASWSTSGSGTFDDITNLTAIYTPSVTDISNGSITLTLITNDPVGPCLGNSSQLTVTISDLPIANAGSNQIICDGDLVNLSGLVGGSATSGSWSSSGDGAFDDITLLNAVYTPGAVDLANGSVSLTLTSDDASGVCNPGTDQTIITIGAKPTANAGTDQNVCPGVPVNLGGAIGGSATSSVWSTSGTGTFDDANILNASYTPSLADDLAGSILLTLTANSTGSCTPGSDQITVIINQNIDVISQSANLDVNQTVNVDVTLGGVFNANDVLLVALIQPPAKGIALVLSDGTIDFTSNQGTVGLDSIGFEVCNQCNLCDQDFILIDILNSPPVIQSPVISAVGGGIITIDLSSSISDPNDNVDLSTLEVIGLPNSGANASIDASFNLVVDYTSITFTGADVITIQVCDLAGDCTVADINIDVGIFVYNALSPNGDGKHDLLEIINIELFPNSNVKIFNRWGDKVFDQSGYLNNLETAFIGRSNLGGKGDLPAGTYFYSIDLGDGTPVKSGFFVMNR